MLEKIKRRLRVRASPTPPHGFATLPAAELHKLLQDMRWELQQQRKILETMRLVESAPVLDDVQAFAEEHQLGFAETVQALAERPLSFARFGDGELRLMLRAEYSLKFQRNSPQLQQALLNAFTAPPQDHLLKGFPHVYRDLHWSGVWGEIWRQLKPLLGDGERFGNSHVTRPIFFQVLGSAGVDLWRQVWEGQRITVVTGKGSRFELIDELFDNIADARHVTSEPVGAWDDVPRLVDALTSARSGDRPDLCLIALGPAGTVLAHRLAHNGVRAIDVGHISDSYETAFKGGAWPEKKEVSKPLAG
jgi:hypothetical protein